MNTVCEQLCLSELFVWGRRITRIILTWGLKHFSTLLVHVPLFLFRLSEGEVSLRCEEVWALSRAFWSAGRLGCFWCCGFRSYRAFLQDEQRARILLPSVWAHMPGAPWATEAPLKWRKLCSVFGTAVNVFSVTGTDVEPGCEDIRVVAANLPAKIITI